MTFNDSNELLKGPIADDEAEDDSPPTKPVRGGPSHAEQEALSQEMEKLAAHPAASAEHHEGGAYLNMQAMAIQNNKTGRHFLFSFPVDFSDEELFEVVGFLSGAFRGELTRRRQTGMDKVQGAKPKLEIARAMPTHD